MEQFFTPCVFIANHCSPSSSSFIVVKDLETILVDQSVLTAAEEQAAADRVLPSIGLLLGSAPPDSGCCVVKGLLRMPR